MLYIYYRDIYMNKEGGKMEKIKNNLKYIVILTILIFTVIFIISYYYKIDVDAKEVTKEEIKKEKTKVKKEKKEEKLFYVDIKGAVNKPGVYKLKEDSRVIDALNMAEGLKEEADTSIINLSKKIMDEMVIIIYTKDEINNYKNIVSSEKINEQIKKEKINIDKNNDAEIKETKSKTIKKETKEEKEGNELININTATKEELLTISGIGESKADAIINYRKETGEFKTIEDIKNVSGIGDSLFEKIKDYITV